MTTKQPNLTAERCDECIRVYGNEHISWPNEGMLTGKILATLDEAELFAYRLLAAVKRARGE